MSLSIKNLNKNFGDVSALHDINLSLNQGELAALVGPSGCGKTTLLRSIAGLEHPSSGQIEINEHSVFDSELNESVAIQDRKLGMVFQDFALWPHLTVYENVAFGYAHEKTPKIWISG
ncbi:sulfate and thiosulfate import ATP-binding protein CysA [Vibrio maritimus]|uniref:Sulfate and thiosulfate import ATP-binding protein CysA n=1 Tax=Vibrio maritimus TaxID=990268 RepID=A0A090RXQ6_9VIBR|nr:sulfate and thiosulfate import ATP-binding protein CysA [Vibrio maritimus]